jgi:S1-C subfamily serine protease
MEDISSKIATTEEKKQSYGKTCTCFKKTTIAGIIILTILISSLFGAFFGFISGGTASLFSSELMQKIHKNFPKLPLPDIQANSSASKQQVIVEDSAIIDVVTKSSPAVVSIIVSKNVPNLPDYFNDFFSPFFGNNQAPQGNNSQNGGSTQQQVGGGSGFFITPDGLIMTNRHVVDDSQASYSVITNDGKNYDAKILTRDPVRDVAIIKIEGSNFPTLPLGDSDSLQIGQTVIAIGNSLGEFSNSVSRGVVSGLRRNISAGSYFGNTERLTNVIQTDAAINPGNSGGPLIDIQGNVIGINVAIAQGAQNVGFALPINQAKRLVDQAGGGAKISIPFLGVRYISIDAAIQKEAQLPFDYGVLILRGDKMTDLAVIPGSPADKAGLVENDIILEVNGEKLTSSNQLSDVIAKYNVGDTVTLKIWHKGQIKDVKTILQESNQK